MRFNLVAALVILVVGSVILFEDDFSVDLEGAVVQQPVENIKKLVVLDDLTLVTGQREYNNVTLKMMGNITLNDKTELLLHDVDLYFQEDYDNQYALTVLGNGHLILRNVNIFTNGKKINFDYYDTAIINLSNVHSEEISTPWHSALNSVEVSINDSVVGMTLAENSKFKAERSDLFLEPMLKNVQKTITFPQGYRKKYDLALDMAGKVLTINTIDSTFKHWGVRLDRNTDITLVDGNITVGFNSYHGAKIYDLKNGWYNDSTFIIDDNKFHSKNTFVNGWYVRSQDEATIKVWNSELIDVNFNSPGSTLLIYNTTTGLVRAVDKAHYEFYGSRIERGIVAVKDATISLKDTEILGNITQLAGGEVTVSMK